MSALVDRSATVGDQPWWVGTEQDHGQNRDLGDKPVTAEEMLVGAGQGWRVQKAPLKASLTLPSEGIPLASTNILVEAPGLFAVVREDTHKVLGIVTRRYEPVQNADSFRFFDEVVGEGQAIYHTAGSLEGGKQVWILAKLPGDFAINGVDVIQNFILLANGHDGSSAFRMMFTPIRVVCKNTLNVATNHGRSTAGYRLSHFTNINRRLSANDARDALGIATEEAAHFREAAMKLAQEPISNAEIKGLVQRLFPLPQLAVPQSVVEGGLLMLPEPDEALKAPEFRLTLEKREVVENLIKQGKGNDDPAVAGTRWAAFNGVAEFTDYVFGWDKKRPKQLLFGNGRNMKQRAWDLLVEKEMA